MVYLVHVLVALQVGRLFCIIIILISANKGFKDITLFFSPNTTPPIIYKFQAGDRSSACREDGGVTVSCAIDVCVGKGYKRTTLVFTVQQ